MSDSRLRIGMIGCGDTAGWRARALKAAGFTITAVGNRPGSRRLKPFAEAHGIPAVYDDWRRMLERPDDWDALAIATWPDGTPAILAAVLEALPNVPVLVEKPVAWSSARLAELMKKSHAGVMVGYNRRHYASALAARAEVQAGPPLLAQLTLPSSITVPDQPDATAAYAKDLFESVGALGLDMTRFIFGDLQVRSVERLVNKAGNVSGFAGILTSPRNDVIQVAGNWGAASNFSLTLHRPGRRVELLPFEIATEYEGMEVSLPSDEYPIRRYLPKVKNRTMLEGIDLQEKPGFVVETRAFREIVNGRKPEVSVARLADAYAVTKLCEELTGITYQE